MQVKEFFTWTALGSLVVAIGAVNAVKFAAKELLHLESPWVTLVGAALVVFGVAWATGALKKPVDWLLTFLNTLLLFMMSSGAGETAESLIA